MIVVSLTSSSIPMVRETAGAGPLWSARGKRTCAFYKEITRWREHLIGECRPSCVRAENEISPRPCVTAPGECMDGI